MKPRRLSRRQRMVAHRNAMLAPLPPRDRKCPVPNCRTITDDTTQPCRSCRILFGRYLQRVSG